MADTKRTLSQLQALYADNTTANISENDLRDGFKTVVGSMNLVTKSSNYTATADDIVISVDTSSSDVTITIPTANASDGSGDTFNKKIFYIINTGSNDVILSGGATNTIAANSTLGIISNGTSWLSINASGDTDLSEGTSTETTVDIDSSTGTNATLTEASTSRAGVMSKAKFDEVVANTLKTGITSSQSLAITTNTTNIATNTANITSNDTDIATNVTNIATNAAGIATNVTNITANTNAIDALAKGLDYQGSWNASTNSPALASSVGTEGHYYIVGTAGNTNLNGTTDWKVGDWVLWAESVSVWQKVDNTAFETVTNVGTGVDVFKQIVNGTEVQLRSLTDGSKISFTQNADDIQIDDSVIVGEVNANTAKVGITTAQASEIAANTLKTGITSGQATDITTNNAKTGITSGQATAITDNTAKVGITTAQSNAITANTAKSTNVTTNLSEGTTTNTTVDVNSSDGTNATLAAASTTRAGVMTKAKFDEVVVNTAKDGITNAQANAITANTAKVGYTDALVDANSSVVANTAKTGYTDALVDANSNVAANTAKVGFTDALVDANSNVAANTAKTGFTQALVSANTDVTANTAKVGLTDGDKGDITVSGTNSDTWTIDTDAITTDKISDNNVTFAKTQNIDTNKLLGRSTGGVGDIEEITLGTNLSLSSGTLNATGGSSPLTTKGDLYTYDSADARLGVGTDGQVLAADSTEATGLKWVAAAAGGTPSTLPVMVLKSNAADATFTPSSSLIVPWNIETYKDTGFSHSNTTNPSRATVDNAGTYLVQGRLRIFNSVNQRAQPTVNIRKNGNLEQGAVDCSYIRNAAGASDYWTLNFTYEPIKLIATDYIEVELTLDIGSTSTFNSSTLKAAESSLSIINLQGTKGDKGDDGGLLSSVGGGLLVDLGFGSTNQVITVANNATTINFDDTVTNAVDKHSNWDNTNKKFIVNTASGAGTYQFEVNLFCSNSTGSYYNLQAFINGTLKTPNGAFAMSDAIDDSTYDGVAGTISLDLDVGDEVEIKLQAYSSSNASTTISANGTWNFTQGMRVSKTSGVKGDQGDQGIAGSGGDVYLANTQTFTGVNTFSNNINASQLINHADYPTGSTAIGNVWRDGNNLKFRDANLTKNLTHNAGSSLTASTLTVDIGLYTQFSLRNISDTTVTIAAPTNGGAALIPDHDGQKLILRFRDNGTSRTLSWDPTTSVFRAIGVTLPPNTNPLKTLYVGCIYNGGSAKWDVVAVTEEA